MMRLQNESARGFASLAHTSALTGMVHVRVQGLGFGLRPSTLSYGMPV
jgi:hypothetical protein